MLAPAAPPPADARRAPRARSHVLCTQPIGVAVSGSYAYVMAHLSDSLVVIDVSNPTSPVIRGSVVSSSLMDGVREARSCGAWLASGAASRARSVHHARTRSAVAC